MWTTIEELIKYLQKRKKNDKIWFANLDDLKTFIVSDKQIDEVDIKWF